MRVLGPDAPVVGPMLLVGAGFGASAHVAATDGVLAASVAVTGGVLLGCLASAGVTAPAVAFGALAALGHALLWPAWPALGGAALLALAYAPRALRARSAPEAVLMIAIGALAGGVGGWLASSFAGSEPSLAVVAAAMGGLLAGAPWLVPVDDHVSHELRARARNATGAARWTLLKALVLRRRLESIASEIPHRQARRLDQAWRTLLTLVEARERAPRNATQRVDARIRAHVEAFVRVWRAVGTRRALADGLDLDALDELHVDGEEMEAQAQALAEVGWGAEAPAGDAQTGEERDDEAHTGEERNDEAHSGEDGDDGEPHGDEALADEERQARAARGARVADPQGHTS